MKTAGKVLLLAAGCVFLLLFIRNTAEKISELETAGDESGIRLQEAGNLIWLLADTAAGQEGMEKPDSDRILAALHGMEPVEDGWLTGKQAKQLTELLPAVEGERGRKLSEKTRDFREKKRVTAKEWYGWFDAARGIYDSQGQIRDMTVTVLAVGADAGKVDGTRLPSNQLLTETACLPFYSETFRQPELLYRPLVAVGREDGLYALRSVGEQKGYSISNIWVMDTVETGLLCFWQGFEIRIKLQKDICRNIREQIADLTFEAGKLVGVREKQDKISGKLLRMTEDGAEIEGHGVLPFSDKMKVYQLYGRIQELEPGNLRIGYAFTDFVVEDGVIEAALISQKENMEKIRVLVKTSGYGSAYHEEIRLQADCDCTVLTGAGSRQLPTGEMLVVEPDSGLFAKDGRIQVVPDILTGHISLLNVERAQGVPAYRGSLELVREAAGIVVVNEVFLEEYLYAVVPSEMPASYPAEALQAQAVCARTYAWKRMCRAGLPAFGAHVDDSTGFQVYQNIAEQAESTKAVKETEGKVLFYEGEPAETYYYSTSCGYGTDADIWSEGGKERYPYLVSQPIAEKEDFFYESREPWYRWKYEAEQLDVEAFNEAIERRYAANPDGVLTKRGNGAFVSVSPPRIGRIRELSVTERGGGGIAEVLLVEGEEASIQVRSEYDIRAVLCNGQTQVLRSDGTFVPAASLLPSGFFSIATLKKGDFVIGYSLNGGGFGHGVGMSQNGAKNMAAAGKCMEEILTFFYKGCQIGDIYDLED